MIRNFLNDIKIAKDNKAYLSALALTIPDICGKIEYKYKDDRRKYIKWFNTWVYKYVEIPKSKIINLIICDFMNSGNYLWHIASIITNIIYGFVLDFIRIKIKN